MKIAALLRSSQKEKGVVLIMVLILAALMTATATTYAPFLSMNAELIAVAKTKEQARNIAEAGINHAFAKIKAQGFTAASGFSGSLDTGSYTVVFDGPDTVSGRPGEEKYLITSTGKVNKTSVTVSAEIRDRTATALDYLGGAENDVRIANFLAISPINGDLHANNDVYLKAIIAILNVTGNVSAKGVVKEGSKLHKRDGLFGGFLDLLVYINGDNNDSATVIEGDDAPNVTFPTFDYGAYKQAAIDSGSYYDGDQVYNGQILAPSGGVVYVDGDVTFLGDNQISGGIIADNINIGNFDGLDSVQGSLTQMSTDDNRNVIIAKNGDIGVIGQLYTEEALVYASQDIVSLENDAVIDINGSVLAGRDLYMWAVWTIIAYDYIKMSPRDMLDAEGNDLLRVVSWNK